MEQELKQNLKKKKTKIKHIKSLIQDINKNYIISIILK